MPRVPVLNRPQVATAPLPGVSAPVSAFTGPAAALGEAAQAVGQVGQLVERERLRQLDVRLNAAEVKARDLRQRILHDPKKGLLNRRGEQALDVAAEAEKEWAQGLGSIAGEIRDPDAQAAFRVRTDLLKSELVAQAGRHELEEGDRVDEAATKALVTDAFRNIAALPGDVGRVNDDIDRAELVMRGRLTRQGLPSEVVDSEIARLRSQARVAQITALVAANADGVDVVAKSVMDDLVGDDRTKVQRLVTETTMRVKAQQAEDTLFRQYATDERAALAAARESYTGEMRDKVVERLEARFADERRVLNQRISDTYDSALAIVDETGDFTRIPVADIDYLREHKPAVLSALRTRAKQVRNSTEPTTDWTKWQAITEMSNDDLRAMNPQEYRPYLSDALYKELLDRRATLGGVGGKASKEAATPVAVVDGELMASARAMGLISNNVQKLSQLKGDAGTRYQNLRTAVMAELTRERSEKKRNLSPDETRGAMQRVLDDVVIQESFFGGGKVVPRAYAPDGRPLTADERQRLGLTAATVPALVPGMSRPDRWEQLVNAGLSADSAAAQVRREMP